VQEENFVKSGTPCRLISTGISTKRGTTVQYCSRKQGTEFWVTRAPSLGVSSSKKQGLHRALGNQYTTQLCLRRALGNQSTTSSNRDGKDSSCIVFV
jgi:hypothetical protein